MIPLTNSECVCGASRRALGVFAQQESDEAAVGGRDWVTQDCVERRYGDLLRRGVVGAAPKGGARRTIS